jgi:hypothetical protein
MCGCHGIDGNPVAVSVAGLGRGEETVLLMKVRLDTAVAPKGLPKGREAHARDLSAGS